MPALIVCGRKSRIGSDDLYYPALLFLIYQFPCLLYTSYATCSSYQHSSVLYHELLGIFLHIFMILIYLTIANISYKGTIIESERRVCMPKVLKIHSIWSSFMFLHAIIGIYLYHTTSTLQPLLISLSTFIQLLALAMIACCMLTGATSHTTSFQTQSFSSDSERHALLNGFQTNTFFCLEAPYRPPTHISFIDYNSQQPYSDVYVPHYEHYERQCHRCCQCLRYLTCNLFGGAGTQHDSMSAVATIFARVFYGDPDLVITDIVAGYILLAAVQAYEESQVLQQEIPEIVSHTDEAPENLPRTSVDIPMAPASEHVHTLARTSMIKGYVLEQDEGLQKTVQNLAMYSKYAIGIYGWLLYLWTYPWKGIFQLATSCIKPTRHYIHGDNIFHLHQETLQRMTQVHVRDIVYASFYNSVYHPAYCIFLNHEEKKVILAIRGTLSLEDCLTDAIAYGTSMDQVSKRWQCQGHGQFAHQGFLHAAQALYLDLELLGVFEMLFQSDSNASIARDQLNACANGTYADYQLILTGHSLGAGIAVLLAILLRPKYPTLHCYAYSPPGCTLSIDLAEDCASYVTSVVLGRDIIAQASIRSAEELRDKVIDLIARSKLNKAAILSQIVRWKEPQDLLYDDIKVPELQAYQKLLQEIQEKEPIHDLTLPGRIVHLKKRALMCEQSGLWICCRPGSGGILCTERTDYQFAYSDRSKFRDIRIARTMLDDHFPDKVHIVLQDIVKRME